jgi:hypothetical protein
MFLEKAYFTIVNLGIYHHHHHYHRHHHLHALGLLPCSNFQFVHLLAEQPGILLPVGQGRNSVFYPVEVLQPIYLIFLNFFTETKYFFPYIFVAYFINQSVSSYHS